MIITPRNAVMALAAFLGVVLAALLLSPHAALAQAAHEGKFTAGANNRSRVYVNALSTPQKVLITICVTTTGPQSADITQRDDSGNLVDSLSSVKLGQCRSLTAELGADENISVGAPVFIAGNYTISTLP